MANTNRSRRWIFSFMTGMALLLCLMTTPVFTGVVSAAGSTTEPTGKTVRVGWYESPYNRIDKYGRRSGYAYDFQQKIAAYTNWDYEYVEGSWPELYQMLCKGELDLMSDVSYTTERAELMLFSSLPMGAEEYYLFIAPNINSGIDFDDNSTVNGKRIGVNKGSFQEQAFINWEKQNNVSNEIIELEVGEAESQEMLTAGELDGLVTIDSFGYENAVVPVSKIGSSDYYFAVNKDRPDLVKELDHAMSQIQDENRNFIQELQEKYILKQGTNLFFTTDEKEWIDSHKTIRVGYRDNYLAFCSQNKETGELEGGLATFLESASDCMQNGTLYFEPIPYATTDDALLALENGEVDCVFPVNFSIYDAEELGLSLTSPQMPTEMYAVIRKNDHNAYFLEDKLRVAVNRGNPNYEIFLMDNFPEWEKVYFDTTEDCFKGISKGEADCILISNYRINKLSSTLDKYNLFPLSTGVTMTSSFAVKKQDGELYSILNKVTNIVPESVVNSTLAAYSYEQQPVTFFDFIRDNLVFVILFFAILFAIILFFMIRSIHSAKKAVRHEKEISKLNLALAQNQEDLKDALAASEQASRAKTSFLSNMSHDMRTPMNAINGFAALAKNNVDDRDKLLDYIQKISVSGDHLSKLINDVLDMSRIESGRMTLHDDKFYMSDLLTTIHTMVIGQCSTKGLDFDFCVNGTVQKAFFGDEMKLKEVLINILSNAVKYTSAPGTVRFSAEQIASDGDMHTLRFIVTDTGIGMSPEYLPKVFDAFSQEDDAAQSKYGSTGLGMAIAKNLIDLMNGEISVESEPGKGTAFTITIPLRDAHEGIIDKDIIKTLGENTAGDISAKTSEPESMTGLKPEKKLNALIVEDMMINAELLGCLLDEKGITHEWAENGKQAVERFESSADGYFDLILMDIKMPVMDGLEATRAIRSLDKPDARSVRIIALSANAFSEDIKEAMAAGMDAHLSKPIEIDKLFETIDKLM